MKRWRDLLDPGNVTISTDHKPIVGAFNSDKQRLSDKQQRQLSFISEYTSDIVHVASINASTAPPTCDLHAIAKMQAKEAVSYTHLTLPTNREV